MSSPQAAPAPTNAESTDVTTPVKTRKTYTKPELKDLGLLRLVTKFSF